MCGENIVILVLIEEKSLRHVSMVAEFLDDKKPKKSLKKVNLHCFKLRRSCSISFYLSIVGEIFWFESERTVSKIRKRRRKFLRCAHLLLIVGTLN